MRSRTQTGSRVSVMLIVAAVVSLLGMIMGYWAMAEGPDPYGDGPKGPDFGEAPPMATIIDDPDPAGVVKVPPNMPDGLQGIAMPAPNGQTGTAPFWFYNEEHTTNEFWGYVRKDMLSHGKSVAWPAPQGGDSLGATDSDADCQDWVDAMCEEHEFGTGSGDASVGPEEDGCSTCSGTCTGGCNPQGCPTPFIEECS